MLSSSIIQSFALELQSARTTKIQLRQLSKTHPDATLASAYAIQKAWVKLEMEQGRTAKGRKIGLTSKALQQTFKANEPTHAPLMDDMFFVDGAELPTNRFIAPRIESELAFVLKKPLKGSNITLFDALDAIAYVTPAIEIIDSRMQLIDPKTNQPRNAIDQVADFAGCSGIVLGGRPMLPDAFDVTRVGAIVYKNGSIEDTGVSAAVMSHPVNAVVWLAHTLAQTGEYLEAGELILAGAFTRPMPASLGDCFHIDFGSLGSIGFKWH
jgi:2-oxo-hept-3-ene-1,7-dioate hydratase